MFEVTVGGSKASMTKTERKTPNAVQRHSAVDPGCEEVLKAEVDDAQLFRCEPARRPVESLQTMAIRELWIEHCFSCLTQGVR